jgi:CRISPR-associated protein Cas8a1/Csx13
VALLPKYWRSGGEVIMSNFTLSIFDPNTLLPHRAGIAGLALALSVLDPQDAPLSWEVTEDSVKLSWEGRDQESFEWLLNKTYQLTQEGYIDSPALNLDVQGLYVFTQGLLNSFLQHTAHRKLGSQIQRRLCIDEGEPELLIKSVQVLSCYYTSKIDCFNKKGGFKEEIDLKSQHLPGLEGCFINGEYKESPKGFMALLFLPLACGYYDLPPKTVGGKTTSRSAIVMPGIVNLLKWVHRRKEFPARRYRDFRSSSSGEATLNFLLDGVLNDDFHALAVDYCEVYQLGKQSWSHSSQSYVKQFVYRADKNPVLLKQYQVVTSFFRSRIRQRKDGETFFSTSKTLPWICDNLVINKPWHEGFCEFMKIRLNPRKPKSDTNFLAYKLELGGLIKMTQYLDEQEQILFNAVQGYLAKQFSYRKGQLGRELNKENLQDVMSRSTEKVVNRLQRPNTRFDFAKALVEFLSGHPTNKLKAVGPQIYQWIHREENWRQAKDLTLLAIVTYTGKKGDAMDEQNVSIESLTDVEEDDDINLDIA